MLLRQALKNVVFPVEVDLRPYRLAAALIAVGFLLYGFVWESE